MTAALPIELGLVVNHKLVESIMSSLAIHSLPTPKSRRRNLIAIRITSDLVNRQFTPKAPQQFWVTDVTEHPTREGRVFACVILDVFARKAVAFELNHRPRKTLEWRTPVEVFKEQIGCLQRADTATTA